MDWTLIRNALGDWEIEKEFDTKAEALRYASFFDGDENPKTKKYGSGTFYHYNSWGIVRTVHLKRHGYEEN